MKIQLRKSNLSSNTMHAYIASDLCSDAKLAQYLIAPEDVNKEAKQAMRAHYEAINDHGQEVVLDRTEDHEIQNYHFGYMGAHSYEVIIE